jgi:hypothetical protein
MWGVGVSGGAMLSSAPLRTRALGAFFYINQALARHLAQSILADVGQAWQLQGQP